MKEDWKDLIDKCILMKYNGKKKAFYNRDKTYVVVTKPNIITKKLKA